MKKKTAPRPSRLVPQQPARKTRLIPQKPQKKTRFFSRGRSQNSYRRNRFKGESRKTWLRGLAWLLRVVDPGRSLPGFGGALPSTLDLFPVLH